MSNMCTITKAALQRKRTHGGEQDAEERREMEGGDIYRPSHRKDGWRNDRKNTAAAETLVWYSTVVVLAWPC